VGGAAGGVAATGGSLPDGAPAEGVPPSMVTSTSQAALLGAGVRSTRVSLPPRALTVKVGWFRNRISSPALTTAVKSCTPSAAGLNEASRAMIVMASLPLV